MLYSQIKADFDENIWTTQHGDRIAITSMDDAHLNNSLKYIEERCNPDDIFGFAELWLPKLKAEVERRKLESNNER